MKELALVALVMAALLLSGCTTQEQESYDPRYAVFPGQELLDLAAVQQAAEQGDPGAQCHLGMMYDSGQGFAQDYARAARWYQKAAEQGNAKAQFNLGMMHVEGLGVPQDGAKAVRWLQKAAEHGEVRAQFNLGWLYAKGQGGVLKDEAEAVQWFSMAVEQEHARAQGYLGMMYYFGRGTDPNRSKGCALLHAAVEQGYQEAVGLYRKACQINRRRAF